MSRASAPPPRRSPVAGRLSRSCMASSGVHRKRVEDLARVDHGLQPGTALGRSLHGKKQREQAILVCRAGILAQSLAQRKMLRLGVRRQPRRVGGKKRERRRSSLRFSARLKWTRPTRFHAGLRRFRNSWTPHFDSDNSMPKSRIQFLPESVRTVRVRYSAPVMGGAAKTSWSNSAAGGAGTCAFRGAASVSG